MKVGDTIYIAHSTQGLVQFRELVIEQIGPKRVTTRAPSGSRDFWTIGFHPLYTSKREALEAYLKNVENHLEFLRSETGAHERLIISIHSILKELP